MTGVSGGYELSHDSTTWVFTHSTGTQSSDLWSAKREGNGYAAPVRLTNANPWIEKEQMQLGKVETIKWTNADGGAVEGVLTRPVGYTAGTRYPLIVNPHGGPSGASTEGFSSINQVLAANGFLVLQPNFRGSTGYGLKFLDANRNDFGGGDMRDILTGIEELIRSGVAAASLSILSSSGLAASGSISAAREITVDRAPAVVWKLLGSFNSLDVWLPPVQGSSLTGNPTLAGAIRVLDLGNNARVTEKLLDYSDTRRRYSYAFLESPLPVANYVATIEAWHYTLESRWDEVVALVGVEVARVWRLYLVGSALAFEQGRMAVDQILCRRSPDQVTDIHSVNAQRLGEFRR